MGVLQDLISQISDPALRDRISNETDKLLKQKKFGLVFEEHLPECTPLYDVPIRVGSLVALRGGKISEMYSVLRIDSDEVVCVKDEDGVPVSEREQRTFRLDELVAAAKFGTPIYPSLTKIDSVSRAPDSQLWHTLIEADNYHALQLLAYLYAGQVDCIYIDPPYNTGAKDWKYNNDYVDSNDVYRHSKWLSMMKKRLALAKKLLNPKTGVLIVTIDEHEVHHLRTLLEEVFSEAYIQMVTIVMNPKGSTRGRYSRVEEYAIYCFMPDAYVVGGNDSLLGEKASEESVSPRWKGLLRSGEDARREDSKSMFYPILIDDENHRIVKACSPIPWGITPNYEEKIEGYSVAWPIRNDFSEGRWMLSTETFNAMLGKGYVSLGSFDRTRKTWGISYLSKKYQQQIDTGELEIIGRSDNGQSVIVRFVNSQRKQIKTVWHRTSHDAGAYGSDLVSSVIGRSRAFSFPKSLYAEHDSLSAIVKDNPNALILDFFAGSGTTLHAVNLLNAEDGGNRRCILVTNNEVSADEANSLTDRGFKHGDDEWEKLGIARYVTWPRTVCSINGIDINGDPLDGEYGVERDEYSSEKVKIIADDGSTKSKTVYFKKKVPIYPELAGRLMSDGFEANAVYFKLSFLDKNAVSLGRQFRELLPVIWMKSGARGECPSLTGDVIPDMLILPQNNFAVLTDEKAFAKFARRVKAEPDIDTIYIITDSDAGFRNMSAAFDGMSAFQLYRDYLDNFRINTKE